MKILVSAYACYPPIGPDQDPDARHLSGGESLLGWNLVRQIGRFHEAVVLTEARNRKGIEQALGELPMKNVTFHFFRLPIHWRPFWHSAVAKHLYYFLWQLGAAWVGARLHRVHRFDAAHQVTYANDWMPSFIGAYLPIPFIWGPIGGGQANPPGFEDEYGLGQRLREHGRIWAQDFGRRIVPARRRCADRARAILVCNAETRAKFPLPFQAKMHDFPVTGVSERDVAPAEALVRRSDIFRVLTSGRLVRYKRFDFALIAFARFLNRRPFRRAVFEIIGDGPEGPALKALVGKLGIQDNVVFTSWLPRQEVLARMAGCDVFLFPSLREGGGIVVIEAMACGKPVIALDAAGPGAILRPEWGIKVVPRDPAFVVEGLTQALQRLADDEDLRLRIGNAARDRARDYYVWDRLGERLQVIYRRAFEGGGGVTSE